MDPQRTKSSQERLDLTEAMWGLADKVSRLHTQVEVQNAAVQNQQKVLEGLPHLIEDTWERAIKLHIITCEGDRKDRETSKIIESLKSNDVVITKKEWPKIFKIALVVGLFVGGLAYGALTGKFVTPF